MNDAPQRTAIVTGAAAGIGRATVERLLADGWRVVGIDRNAASIDGAEMLVGDAGEEPMLTAALKICGGSLDALVCSAGIPPSGPWESREHWDEVIAVDLAAPYEALRVCMPALVAAHGLRGAGRQHRRWRSRAPSDLPPMRPPRRGSKGWRARWPSSAHPMAFGSTS